MIGATAATGTAPSRAPSRGYLYPLLFLMVFFWSLNFVIVKIALREFPPLLLTTLRAALATVLLLGIFAATRSRRGTARWRTREVLTLLLLGVCGVAMNQAFFAGGLSRTSVVHAAILIAMTPVLVLLLAALVGQEKLTWRKLTGLAVAIAGVAVLQLSHDRTGEPSIAGDICILLSGFTFAIYTVGGKNLIARYDSVTMNLFAYLGSAVVLSPVVLWQPFHFAGVSAGGWLSVVYMAVFPSVVSYLIYGHALTHIEASRVAASSYLQPLLGTLIAIPVLGERLTASILIGGMLVLTGVYVTERS